MLLPLWRRTRWLRPPVAASVIAFSYLVPATAQEFAAPVNISQANATSFCNRLRRAVRAGEAARVSKWVAFFPIEVQQQGRDILILDDIDLQRKFNLIFDPHLQSVLFGQGGCKLGKDALGEFTIAGGQILITSGEGGLDVWIEAISPPRVTQQEILAYSKKENERGADKFFKTFQRALAGDDRDAVVSMCAYPIRVDIHGKSCWMDDRAQLLSYYTQVFTPRVKRAVAGLCKPLDMAWRGFMTARGELWLREIGYTHHIYRVVAINGSH